MAKFKITYTTMSVDDTELHNAFDEAIGRMKALKGETFPLLIGGKKVEAAETFPVYNPADIREPLIHFQKGTAEDSRAAIAAARSAAKTWAQMPYEERCAIVDRVADRINDEMMELSAMMIMEMGKNRVEAMGDVQETADLLRYYTYQMRENDGYVRKMNSFGVDDVNTSRLKPYGVWVVISPFNFPLALAGGPAAAALIAGNTLILKPSSDAPYTAYKFIEYFMDEGVPAGVVNFITGPGRTAGNELVTNPGVDGITFTGSYDVGFHQVYKQFSTDYPKPVVVEMGGKNPAIVSNKADLEIAAQGVMRSAFGMGGQKCSACSRVYIHKDVYDEFMSLLVDKTKELKIGDPLDKMVFLGPLVNKSGLEDYKRFMEKARADGEVVYGGKVLTEGEFANGYYVEPAIITGFAHDHELIQNELFVPILAAVPFDTLDEAMEQANDVAYGLTAGFFSRDDDEVQWFLDNIEAGVVYVNRSGGATTGAWPGYQPFGGWKGSGSSGRNIGGYWTLLNYVREQSQTVIKG
ncbi:MAG: aldehyde dehydrogenase family protein [Anaerolineae bacterium]|nr:aldehyde dehydrogenase family protein [Anaerolineae bacterium]